MPYNGPMDFLPDSLTRLIEQLGKLPGIGPKSAQRLAFHLLKQSDMNNQTLGDAISHAREGVLRCETCFSLCSQSPCKICESQMRDAHQVCVVENTMDMIAIERTREYKGLYHVLEGRISPLDGVGPENLRIRELFERITEEGSQIREVILALNPDLEGDTTALYIQKHLNNVDPLSVSRLARGIPSGGHLEYTDDATLVRALQGRQMLS